MKTIVVLVLAALASIECCLAASQNSNHRKIGRSLQQFRPPTVFPYMRCGNFSSKGQPYYLFGPDVAVAEDGNVTYTFGMGYKGPEENPIPCYTTLEQRVHKLMISIYSECIPALQVAGLQATINGTFTKPIHVYEYPSGTNMAISGLHLNSRTAQDVLISFRAGPPCDKPEYLFKPNEAKGAIIEYAFAESSAHKCCGRSV